MGSSVSDPSLRRYDQSKGLAAPLTNQPGQLVAFLQNPPGIAPGTAMPVLGLSEGQARDIAAYLYTLKEGER